MSSISGNPTQHPQTRMIARIRKRFQNLENRALAISAALTLGVCLLDLLNLPPFHPQLVDAELRLQDHYQLLRNYLYPNGEWKKDALNDVVLVAADRDSARRLAVSDPRLVSEKLIARLVEKLVNANASVIVLDVPSTFTTDSPSQQTREVYENTEAPPTVASYSPSGSYKSDTALLIDQLRKSKRVVLTSGIKRTPEDDSPKSSLVVFRSPGAPYLDAVGEDSGSVGNNAIVSDRDGLVRHGMLLFDQLGPSFYKAVALRVVEKKLGVRSIVDDHGKVYIRDFLLPKTVRINFAGPPGTIRTVPLWRALEWEKHAEHGFFGGNRTIADPDRRALVEASNPFKNKIVLFGVFDSQLDNTQDRSGYGSSLSNFLTAAAAPPTLMSGTEIQANLSANILHRSFLAEPDEWEVLLFFVFAGLLIGRVLGKYASRPYVSLSMVLLISIVWLGMSFSAFFFLRILIPVVVPLFGVAYPATCIILLDQRYKTKRERAKQNKLFRSLAAKPLASEIERKLLAELGLTGKNMNITVVACQLHDFSEAPDERSPELVLQTLNQCLGVMMATIGEHGGLVERVWNCGVIGLWGAPIAMDGETQVESSASCIRDMRRRLRQLTGSNHRNSRTPFGLTCSLNSGDAICGTIDAGSKDSSLLQYGALGPTVDLAMQFDSLNAKYGTSCILGASTAKLLESKSELRELDRVEVASQPKTLAVYELLSVDGPLPGIYEEAMDLYRKGRVAFDSNNFREAQQFFVMVAGMVPDDRATIVMLERLRNVMEHSTTTRG